jgi:molybdopterin-guanine dinucleotide biosynthesis protein A
MYSALVLSGSDKKKDSWRKKNKSLIVIKEKPIISYVIESLKESKEIGKIAVIGPEKELSFLKKDCQILEQGNCLFENLEKGIEFLKSESKEKIFVISSDIPLIKSSCIDNFLRKCKREDSEAFYPIMKKEDILKKYPKAERTYLKLKEGYFCGGNFVLMNGNLFKERKDLFIEAIKNRKNVLKLAKFFGFRTILKFAIGRLSIKEAERKVSEIVGLNVCAVKISHPEAMIDLDKESDLKLIKESLK